MSNRTNPKSAPGSEASRPGGVMTRRGRCFVFGDNINTDEIIPARYLSSGDADELAQHCMEDLRPGFGQRDDLEGAVLVAGENFGCGSSREHAPLAIKAAGIGCVVARSFARIFLRNSINIGLPIVELAETDRFTEGEEVQIDFDCGEVHNLSRQAIYRFKPYPDFLKRVIDRGGWIPYIKAEVLEPGV